jgi:hypothetical protein
MERDGDVLRHIRGSLERGKAYEGGNLAELERLLEVRSSSILYVGDHIYGDILRSKKETSWYTAMIIQELDSEVRAHEANVVDQQRKRTLEERHEELEDELRYYQARFKELSRSHNGDGNGSGNGSEAERLRAKRAVERIRAELRTNLAEQDVLAERVSSEFHPYWGSLLKEHNEMSSFGQQVDLYADIYMRRVSCLGSYSPQQYFRSPYDLMPHEL